MNDASHASQGIVWLDWPGVGCAADHRLNAARLAAAGPYDVAIIGAGVIGCALAYELSQYRLRVALIDRALDVGEGTSKGNSAIIHTGFDAEPGSLESQLVTAASRQWPELAARLKIPFMPVSALMIALNEEQQAQLPALREKALANGVDDVELVSAARARQLEPQLSTAVRGGLVIPRESIVDPFTTSVAYAEVARRNGVDMVLGWEVTGIGGTDDGLHAVRGSGGIELRTRLVINASGFGSRKLVDHYGGAPMELNPRRGQFAIYDRQCRQLVERILLPIPTKQTKGMLIAPTVFGNLIAGPTAEDLPPDQIDATGTTPEGLAAVQQSAVQMCPALAEQPVIATYAGLRCNCAQGSYWMRFNDGRPGIVTLAGIRSTGLTASISTAQYVVQQMVEQCGLTLVRNEQATDSRPESRWPGWWRRPFEDAARLAARPDYGRIVCSCENISAGELQDAIEASPGAATLDGLKRRTRVLMGRCQGFNCCVPTAEMIARHFQIPLAAVTKRGPGTEFIAPGDGAPPPPIVQIRDEALQQSTLRPHYRVIVVGAGPAGLGAAIELSRRGISPVLIVDRAAGIGGVAAHYEVKAGSVPTFVQWNRGRVLFGEQIVARWRAEFERAAVELQLECQVIDVERESKRLRLVSPRLGNVAATADAVLFACGAREKSRSERGWIFGQRPARQFFTMQLLQLIDGAHALPMRQPAIIGSDLVAYSAAAKLRAAGAGDAVMTDRRAQPAAGRAERLYFRRWTRPRWFGATEAATIDRPTSTEAVWLDQRRAACDGIVFAGELLPNSELIAAAGLEIDSTTRIPRRCGTHQLSNAGWFVAGAEIGGFHGADWCYRDGRRAATSVVKYLLHASS
ncbi:NAD(P)/FAD-dependent oxidoreductase [Lacipirellula limnantheis]|uniref:Anaerobic glycerol-3-phosphate dehydrogenase subunit A n=1 Tax=Lacipirellula limnantheis TaxID=2528024 RepID=A0A517U4Q9_9BACT|nr:NAD(P)/FAD-dependent oxidoreductase [Lacipirellula limnantheis]QDT75617.1 Anaerobic glycerol-3-phosphate dehydrogenase subunit A [Lacipirellula limnantheis]